MSADQPDFPLVDLHFVADARNEWVALTMRVHSPGQSDAALQSIFSDTGVLTAIAPLDCILQLGATSVLSPPLLKLLPVSRVVLSIDAAALSQEGELARLKALHGLG